MYEIFAKLMADRGLTSYRVAMDTGVSQATLSDWKRGRSTPKLPKLQKLADYFGVSIYNSQSFSGGAGRRILSVK